jgi:hypothetical protein
MNPLACRVSVSGRWGIRPCCLPVERDDIIEGNREQLCNASVATPEDGTIIVEAPQDSRVGDDHAVPRGDRIDFPRAKPGVRFDAATVVLPAANRISSANRLIQINFDRLGNALIDAPG